ncbi:hypothetical protein Q8F55_006984 [Vanrija albida]|uniref:RNA polymerase II-associated protein 1 C-terminal domain-containing protein n=1 Tax=Vanrija albida TaxID=181172 RepID=A0ABR3PZ39_9TREE
MSDSERQQESAEIKERFGADVVELMHKRRAARETKAAGKTPPEAPPTEFPGKVFGPSLDAPQPDAAKIRAEVDSENRQKVESMSPSQRTEEVQDLEERFGSDLLARLRARAQKRASKSTETPAEETTSKPTPIDVDPPEETAVKEEPQTSTSRRRPSVRFADTARVKMYDEKNDTPDVLRQVYFPNENPNEPKLEWTRDAEPKSEPSDTPRFDLSGAPLSAEAAAALPTHLGLHHHGESPDLAGYTISEITHLCYSTVASQRITMMGVLGKLITRYRQAVADKVDEKWVSACTEGDVVAKGTNVAVGVLSSHARSIGILVAAVDLLFVALNGPSWSWLDVDAEATVPFHPEPTNEGEPTGVAAVPFDEISARLVEILSLDAGGLPDATFSKLVLVLRRAALAAPNGAEAVTPVVPALVKAHVLRAPWPTDPARPPSLQALRLLREVTVSSRVCAETLVGENVYAPLLKFLSAPQALVDSVSQAIAVEVLRTFYALGRYGLASSTATSAREIWVPLGQWVAQQTAAATVDSGTASIAAAYFDLLRIWIICAIDPHRTTPEHDLTWSQVTALRWVEELLAGARTALTTPVRWSQLATTLDALASYVDGVSINGVRGGEDEKREVLTALREMDLVGHLPQGINVVPRDPVERQQFNTALTGVYRLHNTLRDPANPDTSLLESPEKERLLWWFVATTQTSKSDAYLRHALLETARKETGLLDVKLWATSAFDTILSYEPGDEPLALSLVDDLLRTDWSTSKSGDAFVKTIGHKDGLQILRPLLHHAILPDLENILGPTRPSHLYLKATGTLRPPPHAGDDHRGPGLPLPPDWVYAPLDELLASGSSSAFALAPTDWDANEVQLTRATLAFARLRAAASPSENRSLTILNVMKVFMLEHGQQDGPNSVTDVFRDPAVADSLKAILDALSVPSHLAPAPAVAPLEAAALRFLGEGVPFFQFYTDLLALFESISFGDNLFARTLLPPLAMTYPVDYRRLFWAEQPDSLRSIRVADNEVPLEASVAGVYFSPLETERDVLHGYARALVTSVGEQRSPFLFRVAVHHLAGLFWKGTDEAREGTRVQLLVVILGSAQDALLRRIVQHDIDNPTGAEPAPEAEVHARVQTAARLTGPRGAQRLRACGFQV